VKRSGKQARLLITTGVVRDGWHVQSGGGAEDAAGARHPAKRFAVGPSDLLACWLPTLSSPGAQEYLKHGAARRLKVIARTVQNVFSVCPPNRLQVLESNERCDVEINLHAFLINVTDFWTTWRG
jgi:hypothetical protein